MNFRKYVPVMLGEYWIYAAAGITVLTIPVLMFLHYRPIG